MKAQPARTSRRSAPMNMMKKTAFTFALLATLLASCDGGYAQKPAPKPVPLTLAPDLSKLNIEKILQQVQTTNVQQSAEETEPAQRSGGRAGAIVASAAGHACAAISNSAVLDSATRLSAEFWRKPGTGWGIGDPNPRVAAADGPGTAGLSCSIRGDPRP